MELDFSFSWFLVHTEIEREGRRGKEREGGERRGKRGHVSCDRNYHFVLVRKRVRFFPGNDWVK